MRRNVRTSNRNGPTRLKKNSNKNKNKNKKRTNKRKKGKSKLTNLTMNGIKFVLGVIFIESN